MKKWIIGMTCLLVIATVVQTYLAVHFGVTEPWWLIPLSIWGVFFASLFAGYRLSKPEEA